MPEKEGEISKRNALEKEHLASRKTNEMEQSMKWCNAHSSWLMLG